MDLRRVDGCLLVVAAAGYGKTTALRRWLPATACQWLSGSQAVALASERHPIDAGRVVAGDGVRWLIADDAGLSQEAVGALLRRVPSLPAGVRLVLTRRWPPDASVARLRGQGLLVEVGPHELVLDAEEVAAALPAGYGPEMATRVHEATAGWPALVRLAAQLLAGGVVEDPLAALAAPGSLIAEYVEDEVLNGLPAPLRRLLTDAAHFGATSAGLAVALGRRQAADGLARLARVGLLIPSADGAGYRPVPLMAAVARRRWRLRQADHTRLRDALADYGPRLVAGGDAEAVVSAIQALPAPDPGLDMLYGEALCMSGDTDAALTTFAKLGGEAEQLPAELSWRVGLAHYLSGRPRQALDAFVRGRFDGAPADQALLAAWRATAHWLTGDLESCATYAERALSLATADGDDRALGTVRVALALHAERVGDRAGNRKHYELALRHAEAAGDLLTLARVRTNLASQLLEEAHYTDALHTAERAVRLAQAVRYPAILVVALCNLGQALQRVGRLDEAVRRYEEAARLCQRAGSEVLAYALVGLGDVQRCRGRSSLARAAYEEALRITERGNDVQGMIPALAGLARLLAGDEPEVAARLAEQALTRAVGRLTGVALLAAGWVAAARNDAAPDGDGGGARLRPRGLTAAVELGDQAAAVARRHHDRATLAEALELRAAVAGDAETARRNLAEAHAIWTEAGAGLDADRLMVAIAQLPAGTAAALTRLPPSATDDPRAEARSAQLRLAAAGVATGHLEPVGSDTTLVTIRTLGRFEVFIGTAGRPAHWPSRKARELMRILIARRGRRIPRDELVELLWEPGGSSDLAHRLSTELSGLKAALDPDRVHPSAHFVQADRAGVALQIPRLTIDVETFLTDSGHGLRLHDRGDPERARPLLVAAERMYTGDFLEDDPYAEWTIALREEVRTRYLHVLRTLAMPARAAANPDDSVHYLQRSLAIDPYDEQCHRQLIEVLRAAGRHGESRRAARRYEAAMREIAQPG
jgi:DNA-binding SARP family transcriptional activator/ATP/maltotriose-dependent transcriptional regulator MalT